MYRSPGPVLDPGFLSMSLLHLLVPVVPRLLRRGADVIRPAVAELLCRVVQTEILAFRHHVVVDRRLDEVAGDVALMIPPVGHGPSLHPGSPPACGRLVGARRVAQGERGLQVAVGMLRGQDLRDPVLEGRAQLLLRRDDLLIALGVDHQGQADGLDRLVHPRVREDVALVRGVRFAAQSLRGLDEVVDAAVASPGGDVGAVALVDAVRNPRGDQGLDPGRPERARHRVGPRDHEAELLGRRRQLHFHDEGRGRFRRTVVGRHLDDVLARRREQGRGHERLRVGERDRARTGHPAPGHGRGGPWRWRRGGLLGRTTTEALPARRLADAGPGVQICLAVEHHHAVRSGGSVEGGRERLRRQHPVAAERELDERRGHHHGGRFPRSLQQLASGQGALLSVAHESPRPNQNLTSTRLPEYWTVRVVPSGINSTVNVRRAVRFVAPPGGAGSMVSRALRSFHVMRVQAPFPAR